MQDVQADRRIADPSHNSCLFPGKPRQTPTTVAPPWLFERPPQEHADALLKRQNAVASQLEQRWGKPYYAAEGFILYKGNCQELLSSPLDAELRFALTATSPPYNIGKEYEHPMTVEEYVAWCAEWMRAIHTNTTSNGAFWLNLGYFEVPDRGLCVPIPYLLWDKSPFYLIQEIVWSYGAGVSAKYRLSPRNEKWLFYAKQADAYTFNLDAIRDPDVKYPNQKKNGKFRCNPLGKNPSDVWLFPKVTTGENRSSKERTDHPAQFPLGVVERIIRVSSNPTDLVLDPFAGSCSTGIAAAALGRIFVGIELREDYCAMAAKRCEEFLAARHRSEQQGTLL